MLNVEYYSLTIVFVHPGHSIHVLDKEGRLPLHYAAKSGELSVVTLLLEKEEQLRTRSTDDKLKVFSEYNY